MPAHRYGRELRAGDARSLRPDHASARDRKGPRRSSAAHAVRPTSNRGGGDARTREAHAQSLSVLRQLGVVACALTLFAGAVLGTLFPARPTTSQVERRSLAALPEPRPGSVLNGSYFTELALWYGDTYPAREQLVSVGKALEGLRGVKTATRMVGAARTADELPPEDETTTQREGETREQARREQAPTQQDVAEAVQGQLTDGLYVKGDAAYNLYYFSREAVQDYCDAVSTVAEALEGQASVYSLIAPNASAVMLSDQEVEELGGTSQIEAIRHFERLMRPCVHSVNCVESLAEHTDEYLFFRTDHHWTAWGAYYAYVAFCEEKGITPEDPRSLVHKDFGDFLGSFYSQLASEEMEAHPDHVEAWVPQGTNDLLIFYNDGTTESSNVITDTSNWDILGKTMAFIMGDQPLERIENPTRRDGSACLVIKDSFGDFLVPWLVDSYQTIWVADFRYFEGDITDFVAEHAIGDLIIESNVSLAGGGVFAPALLARL